MVGGRRVLGVSHYCMASFHFSVMGLFEMYALIITDGDKIKEFRNNRAKGVGLA